MASTTVTATVVSLAHLAEAAAALTELGTTSSKNCDTVSSPKSVDDDGEEYDADGTGQFASLVSDDDDLQQQQQHPTDVVVANSSNGNYSCHQNQSNNNNSSNNSNNNNNNNNNNKEIFPQRLLAILSDPALTDIIAWLPNGRSFVILRPDVLAEDVLPKYLPPAEHGRGGTVKYPSFTRKLNRWGFRQITRGPSTGAFHHPLFRRDEPELCVEMVCQKSRKRKSSSMLLDDNSNNNINSILFPLVPSSPDTMASGLLLHKSTSLSSTTSTSTTTSSGVSLPPKKRRLCCMEGLEDIGVTNIMESASNNVGTVHNQEVVVDAGGRDASIATNSLESTTLATFTEASAKTTSTTTTTTTFHPKMNDVNTNLDSTINITNHSNIVPTILRNNANFVASVLRERDELERMKVARSMLLQAFLEASAATTGTASASAVAVAAGL